MKTEAATHTLSPEALDSQIAAVLQDRFGAGVVYLPRQRVARLYSLARQRGYVDDGDYLTRKGRAFMARFYYM